MRPAWVCVAPGPTPLRTLSIVRHGQSSWNAAGRVQGQLDESRLTEKGFRQSRRLGLDLLAAGAPCLRGDEHCQVRVSPLTRARQTWEAIADGADNPCSAVEDRNLIEAGFPWQGAFKADLARDSEEYRRWKSNPFAYTPMTGSNPLREVRRRAERLLDEMTVQLRDTPSAMLVSHNQTIRGILSVAMGLPLQKHFLFKQSNACVNVLVADEDDNWILRTSNLTDKPAAGTSSHRTGAFPIYFNASRAILPGGFKIDSVLDNEHVSFDVDSVAQIRDEILTLHQKATLSSVTVTGDPAGVDLALQRLVSCKTCVPRNSTSMIWAEIDGGYLSVSEVRHIGVPRSETRTGRLSEVLD